LPWSVRSAAKLFLKIERPWGGRAAKIVWRATQWKPVIEFQMTKTQLILLTSGSDELKEKIVKDGPIVLPNAPAVAVSLRPKIRAIILDRQLAAARFSAMSE